MCRGPRCAIRHRRPFVIYVYGTTGVRTRCRGNAFAHRVPRGYPAVGWECPSPPLPARASLPREGRSPCARAPRARHSLEATPRRADPAFCIQCSSRGFHAVETCTKTGGALCWALGRAGVLPSQRRTVGTRGGLPSPPRLWPPHPPRPAPVDPVATEAVPGCQGGPFLPRPVAPTAVPVVGA